MLKIGERSTTWPLVLLAFALLLRLAWASVVQIEPVSDSIAYKTFAINLSEFGVFGWSPGDPTAYWPIGTSLIYAGAYKLFAIDNYAILVVNVIAGLSIIALTIQLARIWFDDSTALVAGLIVALWPVMITFTTIIASELIFTALLLAALVVFEHSLSKHRHTSLWTLGLGVLLGLASLVRPIAMVLPAVLALSLTTRTNLPTPTVARVAKFIGLTYLAMALAIGPWAYRNYSVFGYWLFGTTSSGANLWMGNNPDTTGYYQPPPPRAPGVNELEHDKKLQREAAQYIAQEPIQFVKRTIIKALQLNMSETVGAHWNAPGLKRAGGDAAFLIVKFLSQAYWMACLIVFISALVWHFRKQGWRFAFHPANLIIGYTSFAYAVIVIQDRYHIPNNPLMAIIAASLISGMAWRYSLRASSQAQVNAHIDR